MSSSRFAKAVLLAALAAAACDASSMAGVLHVNELMPSNGDVLADEVGEYNDWIELYNSGDAAIDLGGYTMTDDSASPDKSRLPDGLTIEAGGWLLLWADGTPDQGADHLAFKLSSRGEGVLLYDPDGGVVDLFRWRWPETEAYTDVSFGRAPDGTGAFIYCAEATPGAENGTRCGD